MPVSGGYGAHEGNIADLESANAVGRPNADGVAGLLRVFVEESGHHLQHGFRRSGMRRVTQPFNGLTLVVVADNPPEADDGACLWTFDRGEGNVLRDRIGGEDSPDYFNISHWFPFGRSAVVPGVLRRRTR